MGKDHSAEAVSVHSLAEVDALVAYHLTGEEPRISWEDADARMRFDSFEEAWDAAHDPCFRCVDLTPPSAPLTAVPLFREYASDLTSAWELVEKVSSPRDSFRVRREQSTWVAAFGERAPVVAPSAPLAICLAALKAKGVEVKVLGGEQKVSISGER